MVTIVVVLKDAPHKFAPLSRVICDAGARLSVINGNYSIEGGFRCIPKLYLTAEGDVSEHSTIL